MRTTSGFSASDLLVVGVKDRCSSEKPGEGQAVPVVKPGEPLNDGVLQGSVEDALLPGVSNKLDFEGSG